MKAIELLENRIILESGVNKWLEIEPQYWNNGNRYRTLDDWKRIDPDFRLAK